MLEKLKYIDIYITIFIAALVSGLSIFGVVNIKIVMSAFLAIAALLSYSLLTNRKNSENIRRIVDEIKSVDDISGKFFHQKYDRSVVKEKIESANSIFMLGINFSRTIDLFKEEFKTALSNGANIKIIMIKPESSAAKMAEFRNVDADYEKVNNQLKLNIATLENLSKQKFSGIIELGLIDYLPPYNVIAINPKSNNGNMIVRLFSFRYRNDKRPSFNLDAKSNSYWFSFFVEQFEKIWDCADYYKFNEIE